jgi:hypothetical protein
VKAPAVGAFAAALGVAAMPWLSGCGGGDEWYDGTANVTTEVYVDSAPPKIETSQSATSVKFRADMGGETVTLYVGANAPCLLSVDGFSEDQPRPLSFSRYDVVCVFDALWDVGPSALADGKGSLVAGESLSLDLTFSPKPDQAGAPLFASTLRLSFEGRARPSD